MDLLADFGGHCTPLATGLNIKVDKNQQIEKLKKNITPLGFLHVSHMGLWPIPPAFAMPPHKFVVSKDIDETFYYAICIHGFHEL